MRMGSRWLLAGCVLLLVAPAWAGKLKPVHDHLLASALGLGEEIAHVDAVPGQFYTIRVFSVPSVLDECQGTVASCPDVYLYISVSTGDLGETPTLLKLPPAKGWRFARWVHTDRHDHGMPMAALIVHTALPDANIDSTQRSAWHARYYLIRVSDWGGSFAPIRPGKSR